MKIFNFGACTSSETKSLKKEIKSINEQIKSIKQTRKGPAHSSIPSFRLNTVIKNTKDRIAQIKKTGLSQLDAKHQGKVKNSEGYKKMEVGLREIVGIYAERNRPNSAAQPRRTDVEKHYLGDGNC
ncbi:hypothetical protein L4B78_00350 [Vibrio anguillarum]|uniref:hypothetical protein n=2 Tax=Vibrio TaxID=662 RepID=UPI0016B90367|nr:hypothetical protein [Vibrio anguillarum]NOI06953.1 hypothetical protein [Vibrio anguillarum]